MYLLHRIIFTGLIFISWELNAQVALPTFQAVHYPPVSTGSQTFSYTGSQQTFTVPSGITSITVDMTGGSGGYYYNSVTLTSPSGTVATVVSTYTAYGAKTVSLSGFNGEAADGDWTLTLSSPYYASYGSYYAASASDITLSIQQPGTNPVVSWLTGTAPAAAIAAGDSGNVSLTFNASSFSSDTSLSATVNVYNNDPQDSTDTFAATMVVRADTAIFDITSGAGAWTWMSTTAIGDTGSYATISIQNDGGVNLVVDSLRFAIGDNWFSNLIDGTVVGPTATTSFKVY